MKRKSYLQVLIVYGGRREARERKELMNRKKSAIQVFKNKIHLSKSEDVIGFIEWFMNQATSSLAHREMLQGVVQNERFS